MCSTIPPIEYRFDIPGTAFAVFLALAGALGPEQAHAQRSRFLHQPDVSSSHIVFVYANDLWAVERGGSNAMRLTTFEGSETHPTFSADGQWIAFSGQYGGNTDIYVIPAVGGEPKRLTWHPGSDVVQGWTPDGKILFRSSREAVPTRYSRFYTVPPSGGLPTPLALPRAYQGTMSTNGEHIAYQEARYLDPEWRNYRGGQAQPIGIVSTSTWERRTVPWKGERQMQPAWMDGLVYYLSERDWATNVWSFDPGTGQERQLTQHADFDVKSFGAGAGVLVYEQAGYLHEFNPNTGRAKRLEIRVAGDLNWSRPRWEKVRPSRFQNFRLSPTGKRALFEWRGEILSVPAKEGSWRNLTHSPGVADRSPTWSPDGSSIAWFNDSAGEYGLVISKHDGSSARRIEFPSPSFYFRPEWSPDSEKLAFMDAHHRVLVMNVESGDVTHIDTDRIGHPARSVDPAWSPDSRWFSYVRSLDNRFRAVFIFDTESGDSHQLTDGTVDAITPVWDESGKYLYFLASANYGVYTAWTGMNQLDYPENRALYVALLGAEEPSPFLTRSDEEEGASNGRPENEEKAASDNSADEEATRAVSVNPQGIAGRIIAVPGLAMKEYSGLVPGPAGTVFVREASANGLPEKVLKYSLEERKSKVFIGSAEAVTTSQDRKRLLYRSGSAWSIVSTNQPPKGDEGKLNLEGLSVRVDPKAEYRQMLREGWRFMRDFLYVDNQHGAPWDDIWNWYSEWLPDVGHRSDFNRLLDMLSGEIAVGHSWVFGGDYPDLQDPNTGLLGVDLEERGGFYRIERIYRGDKWSPGRGGPLSIPGLGVEEGDYILSVNGVALRAPANPYRLLEGTAGRSIELTVSETPSPGNARKITVEPVEDEEFLRMWEWVMDNQSRVDESSGGRLAYVWLPNTGRRGYELFHRMYFAQQDREGAIIDSRDNGGGLVADYILDILDRELMGYTSSGGEKTKPWPQPMAALIGPKVMIINENAASGGDLLPYFFRHRGIGPLVGTRTWGGTVGSANTQPQLIDGGVFYAPVNGFFDTDGNWALEGTGVAPDIEVRNDPESVISGGDPQLEAAVREGLRLLETEKVILRDQQPAPPLRWRRPENR